jgi:hypothetical protein
LIKAKRQIFPRIRSSDLSVSGPTLLTARLPAGTMLIEAQKHTVCLPMFLTFSSELNIFLHRRKRAKMFSSRCHFRGVARFHCHSPGVTPAMCVLWSVLGASESVFLPSSLNLEKPARAVIISGTSCPRIRLPTLKAQGGYELSLRTWN